MYVILLDNGRTELLKQTEQRRAMSCIRCGACLNFCPIYKNIGGHAYNTTYTGPIGAVITPHLRGLNDFSHLSTASTLCGRCTEVCPAHINLHELIIRNRRELVKKGFIKGQDKFNMFAWKKILLNRKYMDMGNAQFKNYILKKFFAKYWGERRELPVIKPKSFNKMWKETHDLPKL